MSFLGFQKTELDCKKTSQSCKKAELGCHNTKVNMLRILTPEGAPILSEIIVSPLQAALAANGVLEDFSYQEILPMNNLRNL